MNNVYLPVYDKDSRKNNVTIYNMEYNKETLNEFLEYVRNCYQDKCMHYNSENELIEYKIDPLLYVILSNIANSEVLDLRPIEMYMFANFKKKMINNYTENDKINICQQLNHDRSILEDIRFASKEEISNDIYRMRIRQEFKNLTISEKSMLISEFKNIVTNFFDLFNIEELKRHRNYMEYIMDGKCEIASINSRILDYDTFEKVYKKIF